jgi:hypothetical protein
MTFPSLVLPRIQIGIVDLETGYGETVCHLLMKRPFTSSMLHRLFVHLQKDVIHALSNHRVIHYETLLQAIQNIIQDRGTILYYPLDSFAKGTTDAYLHFCVWHDDRFFQAELCDDDGFCELSDYLQEIQLL